MGTAELYRWTGATPDDALMHGRAYILGSAAATVSLRRGLDLSLSFDTQAALQGSMSTGNFTASLTAELDAHAALQVQAKLPLDVFTPPGAGLVVQFRVGGDLAVSLALKASLQIGDLLGRLTPDFTGPWADMLHLVEDELDVSIGIWAHFEAAAEISGHAVLAGTILPSDDPMAVPGFTAQFNFRAGFMYGSGFSVVANIGLQQPARLVSRLGERFADLTARAVEEHAATIADPGERDAAVAGAALARILIPLGVEGAYAVGAAVVAAGDRRFSAVRAIGDQVIHQAQLVVLRALVQYATKELGALLRSTVVVDAMLVLDDPSIALAPLGQVVDAVNTLSTADSVKVDDLLKAVEAVLAAAEAVLRTPLFTGPRVVGAQRALAVLWSATQLIDAVVSLAAAPSTVDQANFKATVRKVPAATSFATAIPHIGAAPTLGDLVTFLANAVFDEATVAIPWLAEVSAWLNQTLGGGQPLHTVEALFSDFFPPSRSGLEKLVEDLGPTIAEATEKVRAAAFAPLLTTHDDVVLRDFISDVADPLLDAVPLIALAGLEQLSTDDAATRVREGLAAVLFQAVSKFVLDVTVTLVEDALSHQAAGLNAAGDDIHANGAASASYQQLSRLGAGGAVTTGEAEQLIRITAGALDSMDTALHAVLPVVTSDSPAGLNDPARRSERIRQLLADDGAPAGVDLGRAVSTISKASTDLAGQVIPPYLEFAGGWLLRRVEDIAAEAARAAEQAVAWVAHEVQQLEDEGAQLVNDIETWGHAVETAMGDIAREVATIASALRREVDAMLASIERRGDAIIDEVVPDLPGWRVAAKDVLHDLMRGAQSLLDGLLSLVRAATDAAAEALYAAARTGQITSQSVHEHVRSNVFASSNRNLSFGVTVGLVTFPVTVTAGDVAGAAWEKSAASDDYGSAVDRGVSAARIAADAAGQKRNCEAVQADVISREQAFSAASDMVPGHPLSLAIESPDEGAAIGGRARLQLRVRGANRTFVEPTLGVAQRVLIRVNDTTIEYPGSWWWVDGSDLVLTAQIVSGDDASAGHARTLRLSNNADPPLPAQRGGGGSSLIETVTVTYPNGGGHPHVIATYALREATLSGGAERGGDPVTGGQGRRRSRATPLRRADGVGAPGGRQQPDPVLVQDATPWLASQLVKEGNVDVWDDPPRPRRPLPATTPVATTTPPAGGAVVVTWPTTQLWVPPLADLPTIVGRLGMNTVQVAVYDGRDQVSTGAARFALLPPDRELRARIATTAYFTWVNRGRRPGDPVADWLQAQRNVLRPFIAPLAYEYGSRRGGAPGRALEDWLRAEQAVMLRIVGR